MQSKAITVNEYLDSLPDDRKEAINRLRQICLTNLKDTEETMSYGMIGYVIPKSLYPAGYHCDPKLPLPFVNIASQKNFIAIYHMGLYSNEELMNWFTSEYPKHTKGKLDMGKSCIRFKKLNDIPYNLINELMERMSGKKWIEIYESVIKNGK